MKMDRRICKVEMEVKENEGKKRTEGAVIKRDLDVICDKISRQTMSFVQALGERQCETKREERDEGIINLGQERKRMGLIDGVGRRRCRQDGGKQFYRHLNSSFDSEICNLKIANSTPTNRTIVRDYNCSEVGMNKVNKKKSKRAFKTSTNIARCK